MQYGLENQIIEQIQLIFANVPEVEQVILYGSRAKGNFKNASDIDLTLFGKQLNLTILNNINWQLDDLLLPYTFDLSIYQQISNPDLLEHIRRIGIIIYKKKY